MSSYVERQLHGHSTVPKVAKMAIVIFEYTSDTDKIHYTSDSGKLNAKRTTRTMLINLIKELKSGNPDHNRMLGGTRSEHLSVLLENSKSMKYYNIWMRQLSQYMHEIIHDLAQAFDPASDGKSSKPFYMDIYKQLTKEIQQ